jgi:predicted DNA-binding transcriptional regulator AlpA
MTGRVIPLAEVSNKTCTPIATLRYWRHIGQGPPLFTIGRKVVGYENEIDDWVRSQAAKDRAASGHSRSR